LAFTKEEVYWKLEGEKPLDPYDIGVKDMVPFSGQKDTSRMKLLCTLFMKPSLLFEYG